MKTKKRMFSVVVSLLLCLSMFIPNSATNVQAAEIGSKAADSGLIVDKTATLNDDGTYTFQLEAFATGEKVTITSTDPTDVVLVLDVSGSMEDDYTYVTGQDWQFADDYVRNMPEDVYHKCPDGTYSTVTWSREGILSNTYRYTCDNCKATRKWSTPLWNRIPGEGSDDPWNLYRYKDVTESKQKMLAMQEAAIAFVNGVAEKNAELTNASEQHRVAIVKFADEEVKTTVGNDVMSNGYNYTQTVTAMTAVNSETKDSIVADINSLNPGGATAADKGLELAQSILSSSTEGRQKVVILLTDGDPNHGNGFDDEVASTAVTTAKAMKDDDVTIYTVGLVDDADPDDITTDINKFLNAVSSNYPDATVTDSSNFTVELGTGGNNGYYKETVQSISLSDIFKEIQESIGTSSVTLDENAVLKDIVAEGFVLPTSFGDSNITVQTYDYSGRDRNGNRVFASTGTTLDGAVESYDKATNTITVKGFDYAENCLIDGDTIDSNDFTAAVQGKKLVVTITGVEATDALVTNSALNTNMMASGVYSDSTEEQLAAAFPVPQTILTSKSYVLDYAKSATVGSADWGQDSALIKVRDDMSASTSALTGTYGAFSVANTDLTFTPNTMQWDGFDTVYALGKTTNADITAVSANSNGNVWTKLNFIPANNVYYEDDFVTNTTTGTVGIEYAGTWAVTGTSSNNQESANTEIHGGWQNSDLADDTTFTDGTAHVSSTSGSTATFTFTGTGVDIYSYTDIKSGVICADLYYGAIAADKLAENTKALTKSYIIDNYAASTEEGKGYYQIPTASFMDLDYGTYTVQITVYAKNTTEGTRSTYYLDGIRVYNPLLEDETVSEAYGAETGAWFTSVRNLLLDAESLDAGTTDTADGVVFIDQTTDATGTTTNAIGTYQTYGPKNEVYLASGQAIAFQTYNSEATYSIGLKAMTGNATTAKVSYGDATTEYTIATTADLYYELIPNTDGLVVIKNTGDNLLSITKLKATGEVAVEEASVMMLMAYVDEFDTLEVVDTETEPEEDIVPDVDIEDDTTNDEVEEETPEQEAPSVVLQKLIKNIFDNLRSWFRR